MQQTPGCPAWRRMSSALSSRPLRTGDERAAQRRLRREPALAQPGVVRPRQREREARIAHHRQHQQVVGIEDRHVHVELVQLAAHVGGVRDDLRAILAARPGHPVIRPGRHPGQGEVETARLGDLAQPDVPGRLRVLGELARRLVQVNVAIEDERRRERLAPALLGSNRHASSLPSCPRRFRRSHRRGHIPGTRSTACASSRRRTGRT